MNVPQITLQMLLEGLRAGAVALLPVAVEVGLQEDGRLNVVSVDCGDCPLALMGADAFNAQGRFSLRRKQWQMI